MSFLRDERSAIDQWCPENTLLTSLLVLLKGLPKILLGNDFFYLYFSHLRQCDLLKPLGCQKRIHR